MKKYLYISFYTTADAMAADELCAQSEIKGRLVPVPRSMSAGCGIAYRTEEEYEKKVLSILHDNEIEWEDKAVL